MAFPEERWLSKKDFAVILFAMKGCVPLMRLKQTWNEIMDGWLVVVVSYNSTTRQKRVHCPLKINVELMMPMCVCECEWVLTSMQYVLVFELVVLAQGCCLLTCRKWHKFLAFPVLIRCLGCGSLFWMLHILLICSTLSDAVLSCGCFSLFYIILLCWAREDTNQHNEIQFL